MAPMLRTHRNAPQGDEIPTSDSDRPVLHGWGGIEDHLMKHDTGWVKDYGDDIDAVLVFAGLFSAVLTAFVAETYTSLQPDPADLTGQLLAYQISTHQSMSTVPASINKTISSLLSPPPDSASDAIRWINSLFFVSLVLSIASAFFGILAKQWMREYMQWNSPLGAPRENVLVHQTRIEAWEAWRVAAFVSSIPALLELAMVLFLAGVVVLLWTLDSVVAAAATVAAGLFLAAAMVLTVLPVFFKRCPFKSPTAWACVTAWTFLLALPRMVYDLRTTVRPALLWRTVSLLRDTPLALSLWCRRILSHAPAILSQPWEKRPKAWRQRDLFQIRHVDVSKDVRETANAELSAEDTPEPRTLPGHPAPDTSAEPTAHSALPRTAVDDATVDALMTDISETALLMNALVWVSTASQDTKVTAYVDQCLDTLRPALPSAADAAEVSRIRHVGLRCALASFAAHGPLRRPHAALDAASSAPLIGTARTPCQWGVDAPDGGQDGRCQTLLGDMLRHPRGRAYASLFVRLTALQVSHSVSALAAPGPAGTSAPAAPAARTRSEALVRRISEGAMHVDAALDALEARAPLPPEERRRWWDALGAVVESAALRGAFADAGGREDALYAVAYEVMALGRLPGSCRSQSLPLNVAVCVEGDGLVVSDRTPGRKDFDALLSKCFNRNPHSYQKTEFRLFSETMARWLKSLEDPNDSGLEMATCEEFFAVLLKRSKLVLAASRNTAVDVNTVVAPALLAGIRIVQDNAHLAPLANSNTFQDAIHALSLLAPQLTRGSKWKLHEILCRAHEGKDDCGLTLAGRTCPWNGHADSEFCSSLDAVLGRCLLQQLPQRTVENASSDTEGAQAETPARAPDRSPARPRAISVDDMVQPSSGPAEPPLATEANGLLPDGRAARSFTPRSALTQLFRGIRARIPCSPSSANDSTTDLEKCADATATGQTCAMAVAPTAIEDNQAQEHSGSPDPVLRGSRTSMDGGISVSPGP